MSFYKIFSFLIFVAVLRGCSTAALDKRLINAVTATDAQAKFMASLRTFADVHFCGGTILNNYHVLTSAYCVNNKTSTTFKVVVGTKFLDSGGTSYNVSTITIHPSYNSTLQLNDAAIVKTVLSITYTSTVDNILISASLPMAGVSVVEIGWGFTSSSSGPSNTLLAFTTQIISTSSCSAANAGISYTIQSTHICTNKTGGCSTDDGGPIILNGAYQVGIIIVYPCGLNYPDVHTSIPSIYQWIKSNT